MLYLVTPTGLEWVAHVGQEAIDAAQERGVDLGILDGWWSPAETLLNDDHVRSALRWGLVSRRGIVVDAQRVVGLQRPRELEALIADNARRTAAYRALPQVQMIADQLEKEIPGSKAARAKTDAGVERSLREAYESSRRDTDRELAQTTVDPSLRQHWIALGGRLPNPE